MKYAYQYLEDEWFRGYTNFIQKNLDKNWNWAEISKNPNITWEIIDANPEKEWNWACLSRNPNITWYNKILIKNGRGLVYLEIQI